jgi:hypothetical protein
MKFSRKFISVPYQPSGRHGLPSGRSSVSNIRPEDVVFPFGRSSVKASSVRTTRTFRPDSHQCLEASNSSRLHPSGRNGKSSGRSSEFEKIPVFQFIRSDDVVIPSGRHSVFDMH